MVSVTNDLPKQMYSDQNIFNIHIGIIYPIAKLYEEDAISEGKGKREMVQTFLSQFLMNCVTA